MYLKKTSNKSRFSSRKYYSIQEEENALIDLDNVINEYDDVEEKSPNNDLSSYVDNNNNNDNKQPLTKKNSENHYLEFIKQNSSMENLEDSKNKSSINESGDDFT